MLTANGASNAVNLLRIDPASGARSATDQSLSIPNPVAALVVGSH